MKIVPTFSPGWVMAGNWDHLTLMKEDLEKAAREAQWKEKRVRPTEYVTFPTIQQAAKVLQPDDPRPLYLDIETRSIAPDAPIVCCGVARCPGEVVCLPWHEPFRSLLRTALSDERSVKVAHNLPFDFPRLEGDLGIEIAGPWYDTMAAWHLCEPDLEKGLSVLGSLWYDQHPWKKDQNDSLELYNCRDVDVTARAKEELDKRLEELGLTRLFWDQVMPAMRVCMEMTARGLKIDRRAMEEAREKIGGTDGNGGLIGEAEDRLARAVATIDRRSQRQADLRAEAQALVAQAAEVDRTSKREGNKLRTRAKRLEKQADELRTVNVNSPKALGELIYQDMGQPVRAKRRKGKEASTVSTDEDVLVELGRVTKHPVFNAILDVRELRKLVSTYLMHEGEFVHSVFSVTGTGTGRLSSKDPNLQNIPKRSEWGKVIRRCFIPRRDGRMFTSWDYSQIERRLQARLWREEMLERAYAEGKDVHRITAARLWKVPEEEIVDTQRTATKVVVYGTSYGMGALKLQATLAREGIFMELKEVKQLLVALKQATPAIAKGQEELLAQVERDRMLRTVFGRIRWFIGPAYGNALNFPFQSMAADIVLRAMLNIKRRLKEEGVRGELVLQIHDEIVVEHDEDEVERVRAIGKEEMERPIPELWGMVIPTEAKSGWNLAFDPKWKE